MKALDWNPAFGPIAMSLIILGLGFYFYALHNRLSERHSQINTSLLLAPKILIITLIVLALLDPDLRLSGWNAPPAKVLILQDISSSMDLRDDGSSTRSQRAAGIIAQLKASAPSALRFQVLPFDTELHDEAYHPKDAAATRGTDLGSSLLAIGSRPNLADAAGAVVITDGGDETIDLPALPSLPLAIIGVGTSPDSWNDIGLSAVKAPSSVEEKSHFDLEANIMARGGTRENLSAIKIALDEARDKSWAEIQSENIDLSSRHAAAIFHVQASDVGAQRYRVRLPQLPGELTYANNARTIEVQVQPRALHVLYFTQQLGVDYKYLRTELGADPGVLFTAMYRVLENQFTVQGDRTGFQDLSEGFPVREDVLKRYDCVILGSFAASQFTDAQAQTLVHYVDDGGALILLGGASSFGLGGYADSKMAPLAPWMIRADEPELATGNFLVTVADSGSAVDFTSGLREALGASGGTSLESLNQPGGLRPGAIALLNAATKNSVEPVVAWQRYGKGQVLGIATNTMWRWAAAGGETRDVYGKFWRQAVRGLTKKLEGGSVLGVSWNQEHYRPGEEAAVQIQLRSAAQAGAIRLVGSLDGPASRSDVTFTPTVGQVGIYTAKIPLRQRGDYTFRLMAYSGANLVESYERALPVEPLIDEGGSPELKEAYLRAIASKARGVYAGEANLAPVEAFLREQIVSQQESVTVPLANYRDLLPLAIIALLVIEWVLRRRLNLI